MSLYVLNVEQSTAIAFVSRKLVHLPVNVVLLLYVFSGIMDIFSPALCQGCGLGVRVLGIGGKTLCQIFFFVGIKQGWLKSKDTFLRVVAPSYSVPIGQKKG